MHKAFKKSLRGGGLIGQGSSGCVFVPRLRELNESEEAVLADPRAGKVETLERARSEVKEAEYAAALDEQGLYGVYPRPDDLGEVDYGYAEASAGGLDELANCRPEFSFPDSLRTAVEEGASHEGELVAQLKMQGGQSFWDAVKAQGQGPRALLNLLTALRTLAMGLVTYHDVDGRVKHGVVTADVVHPDAPITRDLGGGIVHNDIKPDNVIFVPRTAADRAATRWDTMTHTFKYIDFGQAMSLRHVGQELGFEPQLYPFWSILRAYYFTARSAIPRPVSSAAGLTRGFEFDAQLREQRRANESLRADPQYAWFPLLTFTRTMLEQDDAALHATFGLTEGVPNVAAWLRPWAVLRASDIHGLGILLAYVLHMTLDLPTDFFVENESAVAPGSTRQRLLPAPFHMFRSLASAPRHFMLALKAEQVVSDMLHARCDERGAVAMLDRLIQETNDVVEAEVDAAGPPAPLGTNTALAGGAGAKTKRVRSRSRPRRSSKSKRAPKFQ